MAEQEGGGVGTGMGVATSKGTGHKGVRRAGGVMSGRRPERGHDEVGGVARELGSASSVVRGEGGPVGVTREHGGMGGVTRERSSMGGVIGGQRPRWG